MALAVLARLLPRIQLGVAFLKVPRLDLSQVRLKDICLLRLGSASMARQRVQSLVLLLAARLAAQALLCQGRQGLQERRCATSTNTLPGLETTPQGGL